MKLYKLIRRPPWFISVSTWIGKDDQPIKSGPESHQAIIIPMLIIQYGSLMAKFKSIVPARKYIKALFGGMRESAKNIVKNPRTGKRTIDSAAFSVGCSVCIAACPFTGGHYEQIKKTYFRKLEKRDEG